MGSPMAPTYANIFMAMLERKLLQKAPNTPYTSTLLTNLNQIYTLSPQTEHSYFTITLSTPILAKML